MSGHCPSPHQLAGMSLPGSGLLVAGKLGGCGDKLTKPLVLASHRPPPTHWAQLLPWAASFPSPLGSSDSLSWFLPHICDCNRDKHTQLPSNHIPRDLPKGTENLCSHKNLYGNIYGSFIYNLPNQGATKMTFKKWKDNQVMIPLYIGILFSYEEEWAIYSFTHWHG